MSDVGKSSGVKFLHKYSLRSIYIDILTDKVKEWCCPECNVPLYKKEKHYLTEVPCRTLKVKLSLKRAVKVHRIVRRRDCHIF
jgi:hypothetical protein